MSELDAAVQRARDHVMTPAEVFWQKVSFVYGMMDEPGRRAISRDQLARRMAADAGFNAPPPKPE
ncbi:MAG: hypothetical protein AAFR11_05750 [Pseudomonadota bacterium]